MAHTTLQSKTNPDNAPDIEAVFSLSKPDIYSFNNARGYRLFVISVIKLVITSHYGIN